MEKLEIFCTVLLLLLVALGVYIATSWTLQSRKRKQESGLGKEVPYRHLEDEEERTRKRVATEYAQETMPKITITPVQPRPDFPRGLLPSDDTITTEDEEDEESDEHLDLGRLYFALRYDQHRSMLIVRLIRAEDIPTEREASGTYVDVHLLPLNLQSHKIEPSDTTINVCFREVYEFPLTQSNIAQQTLNLHICRYDNFSRRTSIGDVFLALAELSAQGIDFTREVFLCRNIISHQEIYRTLGRRKRMRPVEEEGREADDVEQEPEPIERKFSRKTSTKRMWDVLRRAVWSGAYKRYVALESAMYWENIFSPGGSRSESYRFASAVGSPYFSGPGPPGESQDEASEDERVFEVGATGEGTQESKFHFPPVAEGESENELSTNGQEGGESREKSSESSLVSPVQLSPAPEEYYRIVPITPFTPATLQKDGEAEPTEPSFSWQVPQTFTSRDYDVVQTLSQTYKDPRIAPASSFAFEPGAPPAKKVSFESDPQKPGRRVKENESTVPKSRKKKSADDSRKKAGSWAPRKAIPSQDTKKMSPRKEPDGEPATGSVNPRATSAPKAYKMEELEIAEGLSIERGSTESLEEDPLVAMTSRLTEAIHIPDRTSYSSASTEEYRTPLTSPLQEFYTITRAQSDPDFNVEHVRSLVEARSGSRRSRSMLEVRESELSDDE